MKSLLMCLTALCAVGCDDPLSHLPPGCRDKLPECLGKQQICVDGPVCQKCPHGSYASPTGTCDPIGTPMAHDFAMFTTQGGEEILGLCQSWTLNNATELWINGVELEQDEASHHSNWLFVPDDKFPGPDGVWRCKERSYDQLSAALAGGVLYAQSTQATHEVQKFPNGAAVRIPPYSRIISDVHILNASAQPVTGHIRLTLYPLPLEEVKIKLSPFHLTFDALDIPPLSQSRFQGSCELDSSFQAAFNRGVDAKVYFILPHFHALGRRFAVQRMGGKRDGETLFDAYGASGDARGLAFDPPIDLTGDEGLRFACEFDNPTDKRVRWGFGDQEMCELLGFSDSKLAWESSIHKIDPNAQPGTLPTFTGPCNTLAFEYDFNKAGGPPR
jgi:hypothetical protein